MAELRQTESAERSTALVGTQMQNIAVNRMFTPSGHTLPGAK